MGNNLDDQFVRGVKLAFDEVLKKMDVSQEKICLYIKEGVKEAIKEVLIDVEGFLKDQIEEVVEESITNFLEKS